MSNRGSKNPKSAFFMSTSQFPDQGECNDRTEQTFRAELRKDVVKLQAQDHSGEQSDEHLDGRRSGADMIYLLDNLWKLLGSKDHHERFAEKDGCCAEIIYQING